MSSFDKLPPAENRQRYLNARRQNIKAVLSPPQIHPDNPLLPDEPDDLINQLHSSFQGFALKVQIPRFGEAGDPGAIQGYIQLRWDGSPVGVRYPYTTPIDAAITLFDMEVPEGYTNVPGTHELSYVINHGGNPPDDVTPLVINIDTSWPVPFGEATVPAEVDADGITKKYLDDNLFVLVTIPEYGGRKIGDRIECYFGSSLPTPVLVGDLTRLDTTTPVTFDLTAAMVGTEEGERSIFYYISDRKGNRSTHLYYKRLNVTLTDPPTGLVVPSIPLFDDDAGTQLIDLADAQTPVGVGIVARYDNYIEGVDELEVTFDGVLLPAQKIDKFPCYINVPFRTVFNSDAGPKTVVVSYKVKRNNVRHPQTLLSKNVDVDISKPGGVIDPDNPDPVNPNLALVTVQGQGGNPVNVLTDADADQDITVTVPVFTGVKDKDVITLIWKGVEVTDAQGGVIELDGTETGDLTFTVLWAVVNVGGNGNPVNVSYKLTQPDINDNADFSPPRPVDVLIRPGSVPIATFQHLDPDFTDWFNCNSLQADPVLVRCAEVLVAGGESQLADQDLEFTYQGYTDAAGTIIKPNTEEKVIYKPTAAEANTGFIVKFPYQKFLVTDNAWGAVSYSAVIDGRPTPSQRHLVKVFMRLADTSQCRI